MFKQRISSCPNGDKFSSQAFTHRWLVAPSFIFQIFRLLTISFYIYIYIYIYIESLELTEQDFSVRTQLDQVCSCELLITLMSQNSDSSPGHP